MGVAGGLAGKPQYVLHPLRAAARARRLLPGGRPRARLVQTPLPWGLALTVSELDAIGYSIRVGRVFDPCVTETLHRLIDPGDVVADVGANIGYMASLAAVRAGAPGRVHAFEPQPQALALLLRNVSAWGSRPDLAMIEVHALALSDHAGRGMILAGPRFADNMGLARLASAGDGPSADCGAAHEVALRRLDEVLAGAEIGVLKIDVEGHEPAVLRGATALLEAGLVRDIVFEDHDPYPSQATAVVEQAGYHLVSLHNDLGGLVLREPARRGAVSAWPGPSYLATRSPARSLVRLSRRGWQAPGIGLPLSRRRRTGAGGASASHRPRPVA